jgi:NAD(P)H-dependent flavin oxidoreductase YrpB (nitropropane dioxygenase family)
MSFSTPITKLLGISHPILLAPMDLVSDARLTAAVTAAGGFGILGGGYGDEGWLVRELDLLKRSQARFGVGFITWSMAKQPKLLDLALDHEPAAVMLSFGDPRPFVGQIKRSGAILICQVQSVALAREAAAAGADVLVAQGGEAGGHGVIPWTHFAPPGSRGRDRAQHSGRGRRRDRRWARVGSCAHARCFGRTHRDTLLRHAGGSRSRRCQRAHPCCHRR